MSEMVERVAKAIREAHVGRPMYELVNTEDLARAAIEAMREPTPDMVSEGDDYRAFSSRTTWQAMIDEALTPRET